MTSLQFEPPIPVSQLAGVVIALGVVALMLRLAGGPAARPAERRWGLSLLRLAAFACLLLILCGPVWVDESPGRIDRRELFLLMDRSQSMDIGQDQSRFEHAVGAIQSAAQAVPDEVLGSLKLFGFGHRLEAVESQQPHFSDLNALRPEETDTRLAEALRQLSGRFGSQPPAGVVLFSDGRVRDVDGVRQLAEHFADKKVPVHVLPPQASGEGGDVAIVSVVVPQHVRKFSDVDVQVFLRSSGYAGQRMEVQLVVPQQGAQPEEILAAIPITLKGGAQSVPLTYRSDLQGRVFEVRAVPFADEISTRNNVVTAEVSIERPKIRVLYIEGSHEPSRSMFRIVDSQTQTETTGPFRALQLALQEDEDIECVALVRDAVRSGLVSPLNPSGSTVAAREFPRTEAELSAYDCIILSNAHRSLFTTQQVEWLVHWVAHRGGGLIMTGGTDSYSAGGWDGTPLADVLPVQFQSARWRPGEAAGIDCRPAAEAWNHPLWRIVAESEFNRRIISQLPPLPFATRGLTPKPLAEVLAVSGAEGDDEQPQLVAGRYGRGRVMACGLPVGSVESDGLLQPWGPGGSRYGAKLWRNIVYWLTEGSSIGRRRLIAAVDKRFYRPGETIRLVAVAYDETAHRSTDYSVWAMIEPKSFDLDVTDVSAPVQWPNGLPRDSGEEGPRIVWGEEFELPRDPASGEYLLPLEIVERLTGGRSDEGFRIELTAYERGSSSTSFSHGTQVDSTSVEVQVLDDPFERQNTFTNHDLLRSVAALSGGRILETPDQLAALMRDLPVEVGPSIIRRTPAWSRWWLLTLLLGLWTAEWLVRRATGLA